MDTLSVFFFYKKINFTCCGFYFFFVVSSLSHSMVEKNRILLYPTSFWLVDGREKEDRDKARR
jgi:hypothetical protein